ncbi:MAG: hypothetical protein M1816_002995 [Peltula sp. TS41687]|nr:MAG: hypothetical protein M1816_002995 [Peltula sp. TS41687]
MARPTYVDQRCNHYEILGLPSPQPGIRISTEEIKQAYHRALLRHHPDKTTGTTETNMGKCVRTNETKDTTSNTTPTTVDDIVLAYKTLSSPSARTEYDRSLSSTISRFRFFGRPTTAELGPGCEVVDLDDLCFEEEKNIWYRGCRCGDEKGFVVTEAELEEGEAERVVVTGCKGCSLWLQVEFETENGGGTMQGMSG